jgi:hypothetical protein
MFKRIMLGLTFIAAFAAAGLCLTDKAEARWYSSWNRPYVSYYYGPRAYYGYDVPYRSGYRAYYPLQQQYYTPDYGNPGYYYYRRVPRVAVQVGPMWR